MTLVPFFPSLECRLSFEQTLQVQLHRIATDKVEGECWTKLQLVLVCEERSLRQFILQDTPPATMDRQFSLSFPSLEEMERYCQYQAHFLQQLGPHPTSSLFCTLPWAFHNMWQFVELSPYSSSRTLAPPFSQYTRFPTHNTIMSKTLLITCIQQLCAYTQCPRCHQQLTLPHKGIAEVGPVVSSMKLKCSNSKCKFKNHFQGQLFCSSYSHLLFTSVTISHCHQLLNR